MLPPTAEAIAIEVCPPQEVVEVLQKTSYVYGVDVNGIFRVTSYPTTLMIQGRSLHPEKFQAAAWYLPPMPIRSMCRSSGKNKLLCLRTSF